MLRGSHLAGWHPTIELKRLPAGRHTKAWGAPDSDREDHGDGLEEFRKWVWGGKRLPGLVKRREAEADFYMGAGTQDAGPPVDFLICNKTEGQSLR